MRSMVRVAAVMACLGVAATASAGKCREYTLLDNDTGEKVEGCVPLVVKSTNTTPVAVTPALKDRKRFGWKISDLTRGDLFARMGMRPGDVILTFNGYDMASQETPQVIPEILGGNDKLTVTVGRKPRTAQTKTATVGTASAATPAKTATTVMEVKQSGPGLTLEKIPSPSFFETIGLQPGDTVLSIAGRKVTDLASLNSLAKEAESMAEVHVVVKRAGKELDFHIKTE